MEKSNNVEIEQRNKKYAEIAKLLDLDKNIADVMIANLKSKRTAKILLILSGVFLPLAMLAALFYSEDALMNGILILIAAFFIVISQTLLIIGLVFSMNATKRKNKNFEIALSKIDWTYVYNRALQIFFGSKKLTIEEVEIFAFRYQEKYDDIFNPTNTIYAKYGETDLKFNIFTKIRKYKTSKTTIEETTINETLLLTRKGLKFKSEILMTPKIDIVQDFMRSESILFNKKYTIHSGDQLEIVKLFSPKILDAYANVKLAQKFKHFKFNEVGIETFMSRKINGGLRTAEIATFEYYENYEAYLMGLAQEVVEDLESFIIMLRHVKPFI